MLLNFVFIKSHKNDSKHGLALLLEDKGSNITEKKDPSKGKPV